MAPGGLSPSQELLYPPPQKKLMILGTRYIGITGPCVVFADLSYYSHPQISNTICAYGNI